MSRQIFDKSVDHPAVTTAAPTGDVGVNIGTSFSYVTGGWRKMTLTVVVSGGASDVKLWVRVKGGDGTPAQGIWGLFQDQYGIVRLGVVATALPVGTYHFVIPDVGGFAALYIQKSANTVTALLTPIQEGTSY